MALGINNSSYNNTYSNNVNMNRSANRLSTGKRINSAADDAAGLAIAEKISSIIAGLDKGTENSYDMKNLMATAEGGMSSISDSLHRIRDLSVQASNGIYSDSDRAFLQEEVTSLLDHINKTAKGTTFNNKSLLDGSFRNMHTASGADGSGMKVTLPALDTLSLGITEFDLTGNFDISQIDKALETVTSARSKTGAGSNRIDYTISQNETYSLNMSKALSRTKDTDMAKEAISYKTAQVLNQYKMFMAKTQMQNAGSFLNLLF